VRFSRPPGKWNFGPSITRYATGHAWEAGRSLRADGKPGERQRLRGRSLLAERILKAARDGERDPLRLRACAITGNFDAE
jgi:hypothetical protein